MLGAEESLTDEQALERFRRIFGREMTPEEQSHFFIAFSFASGKQDNLSSTPK
jgi:hypothetical protein